jgi:hypothetical protein
MQAQQGDWARQPQMGCATVRNVTQSFRGTFLKNLTGSCHFRLLAESYACMWTSAPKREGDLK